MLREKLLPPPKEQPGKQSELDKKLNVIAKRLHANLGDRSKRNRTEWVAIQMEVAGDLFKARALFPSNADFADWLMEENLHKSVTKDDRAAYIGLGEYAVIARQVLELERPDCWSVRNCWTQVRERLPSSHYAKTAPKKSGMPQPRSRPATSRPFAAVNSDDETPVNFIPDTTTCKAVLGRLDNLVTEYKGRLPHDVIKPLDAARERLEQYSKTSQKPAGNRKTATDARGGRDDDERENVDQPDLMAMQ
jgi:hypothetical protein